jgi:hypothetical protein
MCEWIFLGIFTGVCRALDPPRHRWLVLSQSEAPRPLALALTLAESRDLWAGHLAV